MNKYFLLLVFGGVVSLLNVHCTSDEDNNIEPTIMEEDADGQHYAEIFSLLFDRNADGDYIFTDGICLDASTPSIYTACADSLTAGEDFFYSRCVPQGEKYQVKVSPAGITYDLGDFGSVSLLTSPNNPECSARILFDLTLHPEVKELQFIPRELWPDNEVRSPFNVGYIIRENTTKKLWYCLRKREGSNMGILINFDSGWDIVNVKGNDTIYTNCASELAWLCFCCLKNEYPSYFEDLSSYVHTLCKSKKNLCAKDSYIPFDLIRGIDTLKTTWVQIGDYNKKTHRINATKLKNALVGFNLLTYKIIHPGDSVFSHSCSRTFDYSDEANYFKYYPAY